MSYKYGSNSRPFDINVASLTKEYKQIGNIVEHDFKTPNAPRYYTIEFEQKLPEELYKSLELVPITLIDDLASKPYYNEFYDKIEVEIDPKYMFVELREYIDDGSGLEYVDSEKMTINEFIDSVNKGRYLPKNVQEEIKETEMTETEAEILDIELADENLSLEQQDSNIWSNDKWYELHPDKVLGEIYTASGKYGEVIKVRGTIDSISLIQVPENWGQLGLNNNNPLLSVDNQIPDSVIENDTNSGLVKAIIETSKKEVVEKVKRVRKKEIQVEASLNTTENEKVEIQTFEETWKKYNPSISADELECHVWYKSKIGAPLSKMWVNLIRPTYPETDDLRESVDYNVSEEKVREWIENGVAFWFNREVIPAYIYLSGDVYEKKRGLQQDKEYIIEKFGEAVFVQQENAISTAFSKKRESSLILRGNTDEGLSIVPYSDFAKKFMVQSLTSFQEEEKFMIYYSYKDNVASIDWNKTIEFLDYKKEREEQNRYVKVPKNVSVKDEISLKDAFCFYLLNYKPQLKKEGITYFEIVNIFANQGNVYIRDEKDEEKKKAQALKKKQIASIEGKRLFAKFLYEELDEVQRIELELRWNEVFNNYLFVDTDKVPVAFTWTKYVRGKEEILRPEKREAVAFMMNNGSGVLSYDVGVGKTPSAIFSISSFIDAGYSKRPLIIVPNQVYKQFINEIKSFAPQLKINGLYNMRGSAISDWIDENGKVLKKPEQGSVSIMTYEGFKLLSFNESTIDRLFSNFYEILTQGSDVEEKPKKKESARKTASEEEKILKLMGRGAKDSMYSIEDFGFDFVCYDEAHRGKKVFASVKGESKGTDENGKVKKEKNPYSIQSGSASGEGLKMFMVNQYILRNYGEKNVMLLTATPFTNSPLEIYSVISSVAYSILKKLDLESLVRFFDNYVDATYELTIGTTLKAKVKQVIKGFRNLASLQSIVRRFILYKTGEDVGVLRPTKVVLPLTKKRVGSQVINLSDSEKIETFLEMTPIQMELMDMVVGYVESQEPDIPMDCVPIWKRGLPSPEDELTDLEQDENLYDSDESDDSDDSNDSNDLDDSALDEEQKRSIRVLRGMSFGRAISISPYLFSCLPLKTMPNYKQFVENSPKIKYAVDCIKSVKEHHEKMGTPMSGQVIYMDRGTELFKYIREYFIKEVGFKEHEIGMITGKSPKYYTAKGKVNKTSKEYVKNLFNGEIYNEETQLFEPVADSERIKVIIGSSAIKEGINLQAYSTCLYNLNVDWNPTDIQQLEGRIWRQGNKFAGVRIVTPLLIDSTDAFVFQKLEEKTARINSIWEMNGKNSVLKIEDIDPEDLKYALIRNPNTIATMKIEKMVEKLADDLMVYESMLNRLRRVIQNIDVANQYIDILLPIATFFYPKSFSPENLTNDKLELAQKIITSISKLEQSFSKNAYITIEDGIPIFASNNSWDYSFTRWKNEIEEKRLKEWEKKNPEQAKKNAKLNSWDDDYVAPNVKPVERGVDYLLYVNDIKNDFTEFIENMNSNFDYKGTFGYNMGYLNNLLNYEIPSLRSKLGTANKELKKDKNDILSSINISLDLSDKSKVENKRNEIIETIKNIKQEQENLKSDEYKEQYVLNVIREIEESRIAPKPLSSVVSDFSRLNYMLDELKISKVESVEADKIETINIIENTSLDSEIAQKTIEQVGSASVEVEQQEEEEMSLDQFEQLLESYNDTLEFLSGEEKDNMEVLIKALTDTIEFFKSVNI